MNRKIITFLTAMLVALGFVACSHKELSPAEALCQRIMGDKASQFEFVSVPDSSGTDRYTIESVGNKIRISGNSDIAMAVGLNRYLRDYCGTYVSWYAADPIELPEALPAVPEKTSGEAVADTRYFLNYCTFGYSMPYWKWNDWERMIDWMALNGVNMPLAISGQEAVWLKVWQDMGLERDSIMEYFTGPAYLPWHRMANVDKWDGPMPQSFLDNQVELQKQILARERELGMTPVLPAFAGHVPGALRNIYPEADIKAMSNWGGFDTEKYGTFFINPCDSLYGEIQKKFLTAQTEMFGTDHVYTADPFNEMDVPEWSEEYLTQASRKIYESLVAVDPDMRWVESTWMFYYDRKHWTEPLIKAFLEAVPDDRLLLLDYYADKMPLWEGTEKFHNQPYLWCYLGNFGGNSALLGDMHEVERRIDKVFAEGGEKLAGVGGTLEGLDLNPQLHEYMLSRAWRHDGMDSSADAWIESWAGMRGASQDARVAKAWKHLNDSIYNFYCFGSAGPLINAKPCFEGFNSWTTMTLYKYDNDTLFTIWKELIDADATGTPHRFDVVNIGRQALANKFIGMRDSFTTAYNARDIAGMKNYAAQMDTLILDYDRLLATEPVFSFGKWVSDARDMGVDDAEKDYYERDARRIVTSWGTAGKNLNDYANRALSGLTRSFYRERWKQFTDAVIAAAEAGQDFDMEAFRSKLFDWEENWVSLHEEYPLSSGENAVAVAGELYDKYSR